MAGETNLNKLIRGMKAELHAGDYVFVTLKDSSMVPHADTIGTFREAEGMTVILSREKADALQLTYDFVAAWITLQVHSALEAVGLTAAFSAALAKQGISCNVVAGYYHDHLFVAKSDADRALCALQKLADGAASDHETTQKNPAQRGTERD